VFCQIGRDRIAYLPLNTAPAALHVHRGGPDLVPTLSRALDLVGHRGAVLDRFAGDGGARLAAATVLTPLRMLRDRVGAALQSG
jgi:hypothetical protein